MPQRDVVNDRGWKREFEDPIPLQRGRQLVTLKDAADYIMKLPKAERARLKIMNENAVVKWVRASRRTGLTLPPKGGPYCGPSLDAYLPMQLTQWGRFWRPLFLPWKMANWEISAGAGEKSLRRLNCKQRQ